MFTVIRRERSLISSWKEILEHACYYHYKATPTSLAKWLIVRLRTKWLWIRVQLQSPAHLVTTDSLDRKFLTLYMKHFFLYSENFDIIKYTKLTSCNTLCIPLCGNWDCVLFISSKRIGIFLLNFEALIQISVEIFWHHST